MNFHQKEGIYVNISELHNLLRQTDATAALMSFTLIDPSR